MNSDDSPREAAKAPADQESSPCLRPKSRQPPTAPNRRIHVHDEIDLADSGEARFRVFTPSPIPASPENT